MSFTLIILFTVIGLLFLTVSVVVDGLKDRSINNAITHNDPKINNILLPNIFWTLKEAMTACENEKKRGCAVMTEVVMVG